MTTLYALMEMCHRPVFSLSNVISFDPEDWFRCHGVPIPPPGAIIKITHRVRKGSFVPDVGTELLVLGTLEGVNSHNIWVIPAEHKFSDFLNPDQISVMQTIRNASIYVDEFLSKLPFAKALFLGYGSNRPCNTTDICFEMIGVDISLYPQHAY